MDRRKEVTIRVMDADRELWTYTMNGQQASMTEGADGSYLVTLSPIEPAPPEPEKKAPAKRTAKK